MKSKYDQKLEINICKNGGDCVDSVGAMLTILDTKTLIVRLDENELYLYVILKGKKYPVYGNCFFEYIII